MLQSPLSILNNVEFVFHWNYLWILSLLVDLFFHFWLKILFLAGHWFVCSMIPIFNEMMRNIGDYSSNNHWGDIMPWHSWLVSRKTINFIVMHIIEIFYPIVVVLYSRIHLRRIGRNCVLVIIITAVAKINSTNKGHFLINNNDFFMVGPKSWNYTTRMSQNFNIMVKSLQSFLSVLWVIGNDRRIFENQNKNLNSFPSNRFQQIVKPVFLVFCCVRSNKG